MTSHDADPAPTAPLKEELVSIDRPASGVARLTMNRADRRNALTPELLDALHRGLQELDASQAVRAVVLRGAGRSFCAGADLATSFGPGARDAPDLGAHRLWDAMAHGAKPIVAAVQGHAITGGLLLAVCCDIVIAAEGTLFQDTHASLGLVPTGGETQRLPRILGLFKARELMLTSAPIPAEEAWRLGLVARVVPLSDLDPIAVEVASALAAHDPETLRTIRAMINRGAELSYQDARRQDELLTEWGRDNREPNEERDRKLLEFSRRRRARPGPPL